MDAAKGIPITENIAMIRADCLPGDDAGEGPLHNNGSLLGERALESSNRNVIQCERNYTNH